MDEMESKTHAVIKEFGWQVIGVPEDDQGPSFAYSIGFEKTFNHPEVLVVGLDLKLMIGLINDIGARVESGTHFQSGYCYPEIISGYHCLFADVEEKYFGDYLGQAIDFYQVSHFRVLQCFWPDKGGFLPSDPSCPENVRTRQALRTNFDTPVAESTQTKPSHFHKFHKNEWLFQNAENTVAFTTTRVIRDNYPVLVVSHDEDGDWQFLCGTTYETADLLVVCLGCAFERDRSVGELADLPVGWQATRKSIDSPWERIPA